MADLNKIDANKGDLAEAIVAAAVCASFATRPWTKITVALVDYYLDEVFKSKDKKIKLSVCHINCKVKDNIEFSIKLPAKAETFLKNKSNRKIIHNLYDSVINYINANTQLQKEATLAYQSKKSHKIFVGAVGTENQKETKIDIKITIDGAPKVPNISLKVEGGDQFAQYSGANWETQVTLFTNNLGIDISGAEKKFKKIIENYDAEAKFLSRDDPISDEMSKHLKSAAEISYSTAYADLDKNANDKSFKTKLADFIIKGIKGNDPNIELVKLLNKGLFKIISQQTLNNLKVILQNANLEIEFDKKAPKIVINGNLHDANGNEINGIIIQIRAKFEKPSTTMQGQKVYTTYMRNIIEAPSNSILYKI